MRMLLGSCLVLCSCAGPGAPPGGYASALWESDASLPSSVGIADSAIVSVAAALPMADLPPNVVRRVAMIQPGGEVLESARAYGRDGRGYRVSVDYGPGVAGRHRSVLLDDHGTVMERSHEIAQHDVPAAVARDVRALGLGDVERTHAVQAAPSGEWYRVWLVRRDGARFLVEWHDGAVTRTARLLAATLVIEGSPR